MYFLYPYLLSLLIIPFVFFLLSFKEQVNSLEAIFSQKMLQKFNPDYKTGSQLIRYRLFLIVLSLFVSALARPVIEQPLLQTRSSNYTTVVALDVSASMHNKDVYPQRLQLAIEKLKTIVHSASNMQIAILLYAKNSYLLYPFSKDLQALSFLLKDFKITKKFSKNTNLFSLLEASKKLFKGKKETNIILLSDGGKEVSRKKELNYLLKQKIKLFSICITNKTNHALQQLSIDSGGAYTDYSWGNKDVKSTLEHIKQTTLTSTLQTYKYINFDELFIYPLLLAIILLFFSFYPLAHFSALFLLLLSLYSPPLKAGILDFYILSIIDTAYKNKEYAKAIKEYKSLNQTRNVLYNTAHILYKNRQYKQAITYYKRALKTEETLNADIYYNIANSYLKLDKFQVAKKYYLLSLKLKNSKETQDNLDTLNFILKKRKQLLSKKDIKIQFKNRLLKNNQFTPKSSNYTIELKHLTLSDEERWIKLLSKTQIPLLLEKIPTSRRSLDADFED
jgi:Ca-activated chloride channel family protein